MTQISDGDVAAAALARNDRYLREFVEALAICPFARTCRETGRLYREILELEQLDVGAVAARIRHLEAHGDPEIEVGLLILPRLQIEARPFERFVSQVLAAYQEGRSEPVAFFVVAFHPELPMNLKNPDVAVRFMRRSPDPTIQLVRPSAIERARRNARDDQGDALSRHVAESGLRAVEERGADATAALLASMRPVAQAAPHARAGDTAAVRHDGVVSGTVSVPAPASRPSS